MSGTHLSRLFPNGDPGNGYVEYVRAADLANAEEIQKFVVDSRTIKRGWKQLFRLSHPSMDRRRLVHKYKQIPELILAGNAKPFQSPYANGRFQEEMPEVLHLRHAGKILAISSEIAFEDFGNQRGVRLATELLEYADRIGRDTVLHLLVGQSLQAFALGAFAKHAEAVPVKDRPMIIATVREMLSRTTIVAAFGGEIRFTGTVPTTFFEDPKPSELDPPLMVQVKAKLRTFDKATAAKVQKLVEARQTTIAEEMTEIAKRPDTEWIKLLSTNQPPTWTNLRGQTMETAPPLDDSPETVANIICRYSTEIWVKAFLSVLRTRSRLRMLALHLYADTYRRENRQPLPSLRAIGDEDFIVDCLTGREFQYKPDLREIVIWSEGVGDGKPFGLNNAKPTRLS